MTQADTCACVLQAVQMTFEPSRARIAKAEELKASMSEIERKIEELKTLLASKRTSYKQLVDKATDSSPVVGGRFLRPLADALMPFFPGAEVEILGPYGLGATVSVCFSDPSKPEGENTMGYLQFRQSREGKRLCYVDTSTNTGRFSENSVGAINGMNHPEVEIGEDMPLAELAALFKRGAQS